MVKRGKIPAMSSKKLVKLLEHLSTDGGKGIISFIREKLVGSYLKHPYYGERRNCPWSIAW